MSRAGNHDRIAIFDLDGTLLDSDAALSDTFVRLGIAPEAVTFGHVLATECERLGLSLDEYLDSYDPSQAQPFTGVEELLAGLDNWSVCSNKHPRSGSAELARLGWQPDVALFADSFAGPKQLGPVLEAIGLGPSQVLFVGDTAHDRQCAQVAGVDFVLAGWNPRAVAERGDLLATAPADVLALLIG